eukprot:TRINITY_DN39058_c0_g1_i1.p1 TRINITY_DN39058_c0_g1~~TRINITY_DN39058_c0_g1_i1.p1  ORF type:complete len:198 (+),score=46.65 TRINITY_DN39058_c0_g1_i1:68-661(+)
MQSLHELLQKMQEGNTKEGTKDLLDFIGGWGSDDSSEGGAEEEADVEEEVKGANPSTTGRKSTTEDIEKSMRLVGLAKSTWENGEHNEAVTILTEAIELNPTQALLYTERAELFLRLRRPKRTIRDSMTAISIYPDSAKAHKLRGRAHMHLRQYAEAVHHLRHGIQLLYDEESYRHIKKAEAKCKTRRREEFGGILP